MSRIEELIKEFCPDGVEYKKLVDTQQRQRYWSTVRRAMPCSAAIWRTTSLRWDLSQIQASSNSGAIRSSLRLRPSRWRLVMSSSRTKTEYDSAGTGCNSASKSDATGYGIRKCWQLTTQHCSSPTKQNANVLAIFGGKDVKIPHGWYPPCR